MRRTVFIHSDEIEKYHYPQDCPFKSERAKRTKEILVSLNYYTQQNQKEAAPVAATDDELTMFHTKEYLEVLKKVSNGKFCADFLFMGLGTDDCPVFPDLYDYAVLASGGTVTGAKMLLENQADVVFNPSGGFHHACSDKAGGFCYINDVVLGCHTLINAGKRVLCIDLDAHHGNGTESAFYDTDQVFTISFHESGKTLYPWSGFEKDIGIGKGKGYTMNMPFPQGTDDDTYYKVFSELVPPVIKSYNPDYIVLELGMDILSTDPLTHLSMTNNVIADIIPLITQFEKPMLVVGGGGYNPEDAARGWALCWTVLCNITFEEDLYIGLGGVLLGSSEWNAGLRDKRVYVHGRERMKILGEVSKSVDYLKSVFLPQQ